MTETTQRPDRWRFAAFLIWSAVVSVAFMVLNTGYLLEKIAARWPKL